MSETRHGRMTAGRPAPLRGRAVFDAIIRSPRWARSGAVTVHFLPEDGGDTARAGSPAVRVAYAVGRRTGGAVVRNQDSLDHLILQRLHRRLS